MHLRINQSCIPEFRFHDRLVLCSPVLVEQENDVFSLDDTFLELFCEFELIVFQHEKIEELPFVVQMLQCMDGLHQYAARRDHRSGDSLESLFSQVYSSS